MSAPINDGGSAFPTHYTSGLTMRDWFAGQALAGILQYDSTALDLNQIADKQALRAFNVADAMIAARKGVNHE